MGFPKRISDLPKSGSLKNSDIFVLVDQHEITSQTTLGDISDAISGHTPQFTGNTETTPINELWLDGNIHLENNKSIMWRTNGGTSSNVIHMDGDNKTHIRGVGGGIQIDDGGGNPQFSIDNGLGINSNATFEGNVKISGDTKLDGDLYLCPNGTIYCDSFSGCSPITFYSAVNMVGGFSIDPSNPDTSIKIPQYICTNCVDENDVFHTTQNMQEYVGKTVKFDHTADKCWNVTKQGGLTVTDSWNTEPDGCDQCSGEEGANNHYVLCEEQFDCELTEIITLPGNVLIEDGVFNYNCCWYSVNPPTEEGPTVEQPTIDDIFPMGIDCVEAVNEFNSFLVSPCVGTLGVDHWIDCYEGIKPNDVIKIESDPLGCYIVIKPTSNDPDTSFVSIVDLGCESGDCPGGPPEENHAYDACNPDCAELAGIEIPLVYGTKLTQPGSIYFMYKCCWFESIGPTPEDINIDIESVDTEVFTVEVIADCATTEIYVALEWQSCHDDASYRYTACDSNIDKEMVTNELTDIFDGEPIPGCWRCVGVSNNEINSLIPEEFELLDCETPPCNIA